MEHAPSAHGSTSANDGRRAHAQHAWGSHRLIRLIDGSWLQVGEDPEAAIRELGGRQQAAARREQLLLCGLGRGALAHRIGSGRYALRHPGVVLLDALVAPERQQEAAALLAITDAILYGVTAAPTWRMLDPVAGRAVEILAPRERRARLDGVRTHRTDRLDRRDIRRRDGLLVGSPALVALQLAADERIDQRRFERAVARAHVDGLAREDELRSVLERYPGAHGSPRLRALLTRPGGIGRSRSDVERDVQALVREARFEMPRTNFELHGLEVDAYWPRHRLVLEVNTVGTHGSIPSVREDHRRALILEGAGEHILPVLDEDLYANRLVVATAIATQLARLAPAGTAP